MCGLGASGLFIYQGISLLSIQRKTRDGRTTPPQRRTAIAHLDLLARLETQIAALTCLPVAPPLFARFHKQRRHRYRLANFIERDKSEERRGGMLALARHGIFREDIDAHFH